MSDEALR